MHKIIILILLINNSYAIYYNRSYIETSDINKLALDPNTVREKSKKNFLNTLFIPDEIINIVNKINLENKNYYIILFGPPSNGKTSIAKAIANETKSLLYNPALFEIVNEYLDSGEINIDILFYFLRNQKDRSILLIENIDIIAPIKEQDYDFQIERTKTALKYELNNKKNNTTCIFTTNNLEKVSKGLLKKCIKIFIDYPNQSNRLALLNYYSRNLIKDFNIDFFKFLAQETEGESCGSIKTIVQNAQIIAIKRKKIVNPKLTKEDYLISLGQLNIKAPTFNIRKEFLKLIIKDKNLEILENLIDQLSEESQGFCYIHIKDALDYIYNIKDRSKIDINAFYTGLYYFQINRVACKKIRFKIIEFLIDLHNLKLSKKVVVDIAKYSKNLIAKEIENIIINSEDLILKESIYINIYKKLKNKVNFVNKPNYRAKSILIKYFLKKYNSDLNQKEIDILIQKTENFSWKELENIENLIKESRINSFIKEKVDYQLNCILN